MSDGEREYRRGLEEDEEMGYSSGDDERGMALEHTRGTDRSHQGMEGTDFQPEGQAIRELVDEHGSLTTKTPRLIRHGIETPVSAVGYGFSLGMEQSPEPDVSPVYPSSAPEMKPPPESKNPTPLEVTDPSTRTLEDSNAAHAREQGKTTDGVYRCGINTPWSPYYNPVNPADAGIAIAGNRSTLIGHRNEPKDQASMLPPPLTQSNGATGSALNGSATFGSPTTLPSLSASFSLPMRPAPSSSRASATPSSSLGIGQKRKFVEGGDSERFGSSRTERKIKKPRGRLAVAQQEQDEDMGDNMEL